MSAICGVVVHRFAPTLELVDQAPHADDDPIQTKEGVMNQALDNADSAPVSRQRLVDLVVFEYRSLVVRRLGVTAEWRVLEWTDSAACADQGEATPKLCGRCPVVAECLAATVASDDRAEWRGGLDRADREHLWAGLERTYREVRDLELMRLDVNRLASRTGQPQRRTVMTEIQHSRPELQAEAIRALTPATHPSTVSVDGLDFADFLAQVLASTAANVGGSDRLLASRPGSREASHVNALLRETIGDDPDDWPPLRTELLAITLNVAELVESGDLHRGLLGLDAAVDEVGVRYESAVEDEALDAWNTEINALTNRYVEEYRGYAARFMAAARAAARIREISVDVVVTVDADPGSAWWSESTVTNPSALTADELEPAMYQAHDCVTLPNVEIESVPNEQLTVSGG
jgi:hypothetical protein